MYICDVIGWEQLNCGDVVLDSFNKTSQDEYNILDQIYKKNVWIIFMIIWVLYDIIRK